jgi:hypothetical protein
MLDLHGQRVIAEWKKTGLIRNILPEEVKNFTEKGGVLCTCSDALIDMCCHARTHIHAYVNPFRVFGGPLIWAESYGGFKEQYALDSLENMLDGMEHKKTTSVFLGFHVPCGMLGKYRHGLPELQLMISEAEKFIRKNGGEKLKIYPLLHVRKWTDKEEQSTYIYEI